MNRIAFFFNKIIYDPVRARVFYDFAVSLITYSVTVFLFAVFLHTKIDVFSLVILPCTFILFNTLFGLYTRHKMSGNVTKALILLASAVLSAAVVYIVFHVFVFSLILVTYFIISLTVIPRYFLNFHRKESKNKHLQQIIFDTAPILVVGGGGYIGTAVVEQLLQENYKVRVFDKFLYGKEVFKDMKNIRNLETIEGDMADIYSLTMALKNIQSVVHLAGIVGDPASAVDEKLTRHVNVFATRMLKEAVKAFQVQKFIFASSCSVYGFTSKIAHENSPLNPLSLYAQTKIDAEKELLQDTFDEFHPTILRFTTVFGHSRKPRFDLVANLFVAQAFNNQKLTVIGGNQWRPFIHVTDVARSISSVLKAPKEKVSRQVFNVGDDSINLRISDLARMVKKIAINDKKIKVVTTKESFDKRSYRVSFEKIKKQLGFASSVSMEEGLREIYENFKNGKYRGKHTDPYYSSFEAVKLIKKDYYERQH